MSLFRTVTTACPSCGKPNTFDLVHSVNADRRPDLREQILARRFQEQTCTGCTGALRVEPEFTYVHTGGRVWLAVWPASNLDAWDVSEARSRKAFDAFYGDKASEVAQAIGRELRVRVAFGWEAAREKLVAMEAGVDDMTLELAKIALLREVDGLGPQEDRELRLLGIDDAQRLVLGLFETGSEVLLETLSVSRGLLGEIEADEEGWQALRDRLRDGLFVDLSRLTIDKPQPARAA
jgi:hypothetical protein